MFWGPLSVTGEETSYLGWFVFVLLTSVPAYPVFLFASVLKLRREGPITAGDIRHCLLIAAKALMPLFFLTCLMGFFVVGLGTVAVSWLLQLAGLPDEYFDLSAHPETLYGPMFGLYALWWLFSVIVVVRELPSSRDERFINF